MVKACLGWFLVCSLALAGTDPSSDSQWETAIALLDQSKAQDAIPLFEDWLAKHESHGTRVPEAHHNLSVAYTQTENWGPAMYHLAVSAGMRLNPLYLSEALRTMTLIQNRLMLPHAVSTSLGYRLSLFLSPKLLWFFGVLGFWFLAFWIFLPQWAKALRPAATTALVIAGLGASVRWTLPRFAVVQANDAGTALTHNGQKLVDLPAGTLVRVRKVTDSESTLAQPFVGSLPPSALRLLN